MAVDPYALTSLVAAKAYLRVTVATDDALIEDLIDAASAQVENFCQRQFRSRAYAEWYDGTGSTHLLLNQRPVTCFIFLAIDTRGALQVQNASADASYAYVQVDNTQVTLTIEGGAHDGSDVLTFAANPTVTDVVNAINALGKNWTASVLSAFGYFLSTELQPCSGLNCLDALITLDIPDKPASEYRVYADRGEIYYEDGFPAGCQNVRVKYTAGYAAVPYDLEEIVWQLIEFAYRRTQHDTALKSEKLGDYSWTAADLQIPKDLKRRLCLWRKDVIANPL